MLYALSILLIRRPVPNRFSSLVLIAIQAPATTAANADAAQHAGLRRELDLRGRVLIRLGTSAQPSRSMSVGDLQRLLAVIRHICDWTTWGLSDTLTKPADDMLGLLEKVPPVSICVHQG